MQLTFLGTRGEIDARTRRHRMHTSLLVSYRSAKVMIDCGLDWLGKLKRVSPNAIVLTHAHPDHAWGLKQGKALIGHSPIRTQLTWCQKEGAPRAIITHCGSEIVIGDEREISAKIRSMAAERRVDVRIAYDRMKVKL